MYFATEKGRKHDAASTMLEVRCPIFRLHSKYVYVGIQYLNFDRFTQNQFRRESQILISYNLGTLYIGIKNQTATLSRKCLAASCNFSYEKANELRASCVLCKCVTRTCRGHTMRPLFPSRLCKMRGPKNSPHRALRIAHARSWVTIDQVSDNRHELVNQPQCILHSSTPNINLLMCRQPHSSN